MEFTKSLSRPALAAIAFGTVSVGYGIRAILAPFDFARDFGLPRSLQSPSSSTTTTSTTQDTAFVKTTGGRTAALGVAIVSLGLLGDVRASGIVLMSCVVSGLTDTVVTYSATRSTDGALQHAIGTVVLGSLGWYLTIQGA